MFCVSVVLKIVYCVLCRITTGSQRNIISADAHYAHITMFRVLRLIVLTRRRGELYVLNNTTAYGFDEINRNIQWSLFRSA